MAYQLLTAFPPQFEDVNGNPLSGGSLEFYIWNTSTPVALYSDDAGTSLGTSCTLNSLGKPQNSGGTAVQLFGDSTQSAGYKIVVKDADGAVVPPTVGRISASITPADLADTSSASLGDAMIGVKSALSSAIARTQHSKNSDIVSVEDFGAVGDGATSDSAAFNAATASGARVVYARGNYYLPTMVSIAANQALILSGASITSPAGVTTFEALEKDGWSVVGPFTINGAAPSGTTAIGIAIEGCRNWSIIDYTASRIGGHGVRLKPGVAPADQFNMGYVRGFRARSCYIGWEDIAGDGAEYCIVSDIDVSDCSQVGVITCAGNIIWNGGNITANTDGLYVNAGTNHAHGICSSLNVNHNTSSNVVCTGLINGQTFNACHIYANDLIGGGNIYLNGCRGVTFDGGTLDCQVYNDSGTDSGLNFVRNMYCPGDYGDVQVLSLNGAAGSVIFHGCFGAGAFTSGVTINSPSDCYALARRDAGSSQSISTNTVLLFPTAVRDLRGLFSTAGGGFTVPADGAGLYRIHGKLYFVGSTVDDAATTIQLRVDAAVYDVFLPNAKSGTTVLCVDVLSERFLSAGAVVDLIATAAGASSSVTFGGSTWGSQISFQKIA